MKVASSVSAKLAIVALISVVLVSLAVDWLRASELGVAHLSCQQLDHADISL